MASISHLRPLAAPAAQPFPAMADPLVVDDFANCWMPHPFHPGLRTFMPLCRGAFLAWAPFPDVDGAVLSVWGGHPADPSDEGVAVAVSRAGIRALIADLTSIADQLDAA